MIDWAGRLDALVNNAGWPISAPSRNGFRALAHRHGDQSRRRVPLFAGRDPASESSRGAIVNIASISGLRASTPAPPTGTSKAAVIHLTQQQAAELGEYGIRANCVAPGPVRTKLAMAVHTQDIIDAYHDAIP